MVLYDIVQLDNVELNVSNTYPEIINDIPLAPIYKMIDITNNNLKYEQLLSFFQDINLSYSFLDITKEIKWLPQSSQDKFTLDNINTLNELIGAKKIDIIEISPINNSTENIKTAVNEDNIIFNYTSTIKPDIDILKENIKKQSDVENINIQIIEKDMFNSQTKYTTIITIIPKPNTILNDLSKQLNENIDKILTIPENKENKEKKSYMIYIIISIIIIALIFLLLKILHKI